MNVTLGFALDFKQEQAFDLKIAAADCYKIYLDGEFFAFGPQRGRMDMLGLRITQGKQKELS